MKKTLMIALVAMVLGMLGCRKGINSDVQANTELTEKFFKLPANIKPEVKKVYDYLKEKNIEKEFVSGFAAKQGIPVWDKAKISTAQIGRAHV